MIGNYVTMPSGLMLPSRVAKAEIDKWNRPKAMDFFAGAGGMSLGTIQGGMEVVAAAESEPGAVVTYMTNLCRYGEVSMHFVTEDDRREMERCLETSFKRAGVFPTAGKGWISHQPRTVPGVKHIFVGDVRKLSSQRVLDVLEMEPGELDCIMGGPPCQGYSRAGKQDIMDPRNSLVFEFARFIVEMRPKTMVMEEVPAIVNMVTPDGLPVIDQLAMILEEGGFGLFNAIKATIAAQTGSVGFVRGKKTKKTKPPTQQDQSIDCVQADLFEAAE